MSPLLEFFLAGRHHLGQRDPDLQGDEKLGPEAQARFLPSRFTVRGEAIDIKGETCNQLACPNCHLVVSRVLVEMSPLFISILVARLRENRIF